MAISALNMSYGDVTERRDPRSPRERAAPATTNYGAMNREPNIPRSGTPRQMPQGAPLSMPEMPKGTRPAPTQAAQANDNTVRFSAMNREPNIPRSGTPRQMPQGEPLTVRSMVAGAQAAPTRKAKASALSARPRSNAVYSPETLGQPEPNPNAGSFWGRVGDALMYSSDRAAMAAPAQVPDDPRRAALLAQIPTGAEPSQYVPPPPVSDAYPDETQRAMRQGPRGASPVGPQATRQRAVPGAEGVTRYDNVTGLQSPLYTNLPGAQAIDQMQGGSVNTIGGPSVEEMLARADRMRAIREGNTALRDNLNFNAGGAAGRQYTQQELERNMLTSNSRSDRQSAMRLLGERTAADAQARTAERNAQSALDQTNLQGQWAMSQQGLRNAGALDRTTRESVINRERLAAKYTADFQKAIAELDGDPSPEAQARRQQLTLEYRDNLGALRTPESDGVQAYANGGEVQAYGAAPNVAQALPQINEYRDYVDGTRRLGLPAIPFEQFSAMRQGAQQIAQAQQPVQPYSAMGFANGGPIPKPNAVSGKMVIDTDPNAPTDSIPALIDGQQPAALDSGEFVVPDDVVRFFGTDRFNKMIAQARQSMQGKPPTE